MNQFPILVNTRQVRPLAYPQFQKQNPLSLYAAAPIQSVQIALAQPSIQAYQAALAPQLKFGSHSLVEKEYATTISPAHFISYDLVPKTLRSLYLQTVYKKDENDPSHLKLALGPSLEADNALSMSLANNLLFFERPLDTIISGAAGPASVPTIMLSRLYDGYKLTNAPANQTGKAFMYPTALFKLGPVNAIAGGGENQVVQARRKISNSHLGKRLAMFMKATGITDIKQAHKDLTSAKEYTALEALAYGEYGLVDGILVGRNQVLTRENLEKYYEENGFYQDGNAELAEKRKSLFNNSVSNIYKIDSKFLVPLRAFSPDSVMEKQNRSGLFHSLKAKDDSRKNALRIASMPLGHYGSGIETQKHHRDYDAGNGFFDPIYKSRHMESKLDAASLKSVQINIVGSRGGSSLIDDDVIYYGDTFSLSSADQLVDSLRALKEKKLLQAKSDNRKPNNIKIILDSPGGEVDGFHKMLEELESDTQIKTDIILNGRAYSCGGLLLSAATGNRLATPISEIMLHNVSVGARYASNEVANQEADNMDKINKNSIRLVAKASGKPEKDVDRDFLKTTYMNVLDALFYGEKGLLDGIVIGPHQAITKKDVLEYLTTDPEAQAEISKEVRFFEGKASDPDFDSNNSPETLVKKYLAHRWDNFHDRPAIEPDKPNTLFDDPLNTIMKIASKKEQDHNMQNKKQFRNTISRPPEGEAFKDWEIAHFIIPLVPPPSSRK